MQEKRFTNTVVEAVQYTIIRLCAKFIKSLAVFPRQPDQTHLGNVEMQSPPKPQQSLYLRREHERLRTSSTIVNAPLSLPGTAAVDLIGLRLDSDRAAREDGGSRRVGIGSVERWRS